MSDLQLIFLLALIGLVAYPIINHLLKKQTKKDEEKAQNLISNFEEEIKDKLKSIDFTINRSFLQPPITKQEQQLNTQFFSFQQKPFALLLDDKRRQLAIIEQDKLFIFSISQLRSVVIERKTQINTTIETKKKGVVSRAVIGGAIAGEVGAIIAASTANEVSHSQSKEEYLYNILIIQTKDFNNPIFKFNHGYKYYQEVEKWCNILNILIEENKN